MHSDTQDTRDSSEQRRHWRYVLELRRGNDWLSAGLCELGGDGIHVRSSQMPCLGKSMDGFIVGQSSLRSTTDILPCYTVRFNGQGAIVERTVSLGFCAGARKLSEVPQLRYW